MATRSAAAAQGAGHVPPKWASGTTYALDALVWSPVSRLTYIRIVAGAGTTDPSADGTNWALFGPSKLRSVQRGVITIATPSITATATITAVDPAKSVCRFMGASITAGTSWGAGTGARVDLTNATTVTARREDPSAHNTLVGYEVEEWW